MVGGGRAEPEYTPRTSETVVQSSRVKRTPTCFSNAILRTRIVPRRIRGRAGRRVMDSTWTLARRSGLATGIWDVRSRERSISVNGGSAKDDGMAEKGYVVTSGSGSISISVLSDANLDTECGQPVGLKMRTDSRPLSLSLKWTFLEEVAGMDLEREWRGLPEPSEMTWEGAEDLREDLRGLLLGEAMLDELVRMTRGRGGVELE
jgi:hypothetical protein